MTPHEKTQDEDANTVGEKNFAPVYCPQADGLPVSLKMQSEHAAGLLFSATANCDKEK